MINLASAVQRFSWNSHTVARSLFLSVEIKSNFFYALV